MTTTSWAAVAHTPGDALSIVQIALDEPRDDEVLIRMVASGICHTDISASTGRLPTRMPIVLGHEGAGVVERVGARVRGVGPGDRVLLTPDFCGVCTQCRQGHTAYCEATGTLVFGGTRIDGTTKASLNGEPVRAGFFGQSSFAQYSLVTERNILKVPADAPLHLLAALSCGVNAGAGAVLNSLRPGPEHSIAVFGAGTVGLAAVMAARMSGARRIVAVDRHASRLDLARELGATHTVNTAEEGDTVAAIRAAVPDGVDRALDSTGVASVLLSAIRSLAVRGVCGFVAGTGGVPLDLDVNDMLTKGTQLRAIMGGDGTGLVFLRKLVEYFSEGKLPVQSLITEYSLADVNSAIADMRAGTAIKPVIRFD